MEQDARALQLVELIYAGTIDSSAWDYFVEQLSDLCGGAAVIFSVQLPNGPPLAYHLARYEEALSELPQKYLLEGRLPWGSILDDQFKGRFALASENFPDADVPDTPFYKEAMEPQGLAPCAPIVHVIANDPERPISGIGIWRRQGGRPFTEDDLTFCNRLVPHLDRAFEIHGRFGDIRNQHGSMAEVLDRIPVGIIMVDAAGQPVLVNRMAEEMTRNHDGISAGPEGVRGANARESQRLRERLGEAIAQGISDSPGRNTVMSLSRPSGKRPYTVVVAPLLSHVDGRRTHDAVAALFVADPDATGISTTDFLQALYGLTPAEAELVALLAAGRSLEEAAAERGVTISTIRSQLKQVFLKTQTKRQGQLVRLVLTGVAGIQDEAIPRA